MACYIYENIMELIISTEKTNLLSTVIPEKNCTYFYVLLFCQLHIPIIVRDLCVK